MFPTPHIITLPQIGDSVLGYISIAEGQKNIPFEIKRVYWTYYTPQNVIRGQHAHKALHQLIFAVSGKIVFETENINRKKEKFILENPNEGLYLPPFTWREIQFSHNAVLLCLASEIYTEDDYLRTYEAFEHEVEFRKI
jgi:dTDP-4-dehydrorhamnose 3,5-epimerase-like enzyme